MPLDRKPLINKVHLGPKLVGGADQDTARRLADAMPYIGDSSKAFAKSLIQNQSMYGWSDKQRHWAGVLLDQARIEYRARRQAEGQESAAKLNTLLDAAEAAVSNPAMAKLQGLFKRAADTLKKPSILVRIGDRVARVKPGREAGSLVLFWKDEQGSGAYCGAVAPTGIVRTGIKGGQRPSLIAAALNAFASPEQAAKAYGDATGICCFCARELTDARSVTKGYGPICASKWCLPWG